MASNSKAGSNSISSDFVRTIRSRSRVGVPSLLSGKEMSHSFNVWSGRWIDASPGKPCTRYGSQGSLTRAPVAWKSGISRLITCSPWRIAVAAITALAAGTTCPAKNCRSFTRQSLRSARDCRIGLFDQGEPVGVFQIKPDLGGCSECQREGFRCFGGDPFLSVDHLVDGRS